MPDKSLLVITGPTAIGKTDLAIELALKLGTEIISADSRQFYKEMRIGTARPSDEQLAKVKHHLIAHLSIHDTYNVSMFEHDVLHLLEKLFKKHDVVILCGGSGLYIDAVCKGIDELPDADEELRASLNMRFEEEGIESLQQELRQLDPEYYEIVDRKNPKRLMRAIEVCRMSGKKFSELRRNQNRQREFRIIKTALNMEREELFGRISLRTEKMTEEGLLEEVKSLLPYKGLNALNTVGYKEIFDYLEGACSLSQAIEKIKTNTRRYAKRQLTWFRKDEEIIWFHPSEGKKILELH